MLRGKAREITSLPADEKCNRLFFAFESSARGNLGDFVRAATPYRGTKERGWWIQPQVPKKLSTPRFSLSLPPSLSVFLSRGEYSREIIETECLIFVCRRSARSSSRSPSKNRARESLLTGSSTKISVEFRSLFESRHCEFNCTRLIFSNFFANSVPPLQIFAVNSRMQTVRCTDTVCLPFEARRRNSNFDVANAYCYRLDLRPSSLSF